MTWQARHEVEESPAPDLPRTVGPQWTVANSAGRVLDLQRRCGNRAVARMLARPPRRMLQRLHFKLGKVRVDVDYGDIYAIPEAAAAAEVRTRYAAYTGTPIPAAVDAALTALTPAKQRWVLYGFSILQRNAAAAPGLDKAAAVKRLIDRAPSSTTSPTGGGRDHIDEVLRVSGWAEQALAAPLNAPTGATLADIRQLYNPPTSTGSASALLDTAVLNADLPPALEAFLIARDPGAWLMVGTVALSTLKTIADEIQQEARVFFAPYADTAMTSPYATGWKYSSQLFSVTATVPTQAERISYLMNRAELVGRRPAPGGSIFERTNFESGRDDAALLAIVTTMEANPTIAGIVDRLLQHTGRLERPSLRVGISTEWDLSAASECETRWRNIQTLSHELCHALAHPAFPARESSIRFGQIIREGFTEALGVQLYDHLRKRAKSDPAFKLRMEAAVAGAPCPEPPAGKVGYGAAGESAEKIRQKVDDDRFRAAYFLGAVHLVGL
jgi:hypothetical protein